MGRHWANAIAACALLLFATCALADGVMLDGVSPRSVARGGTNLGFFDNGGVIYDNPGAMVNVCGQGLVDIGGEGLFVSGHYAEPGTNVYSTTFTPLPQIGIIKKSCDGCWAVGAGIFTPAGFSERFNMEGPVPIVGNRRYETFGALVKIPVGLAYRVTDRLSIGGTVGLGVSYADLEGPYFLNGPNPLAGTPTDLRRTGSARLYLVGRHAVLRKRLHNDWGLVPERQPVRAQWRFQYHGAGAGHHAVRFRAARRVAAVGGHRHPARAVSAPHHCGRCGVVRLVALVRPFCFVAQRPEQSGVSGRGAAIDRPLTAGLRDSVSYRFGYEQQLNDCVTMRIGYVYHSNSIPDATLTPFIQAFLEHTVSVGFDWCWRGWYVDLGYIHMFAPRQHVGASSLAGGDFSGSTQDVAVDAILLGLMRPF